MKIYRRQEDPIRDEIATAETWLAQDDGIIACWECGRMMAAAQPELAEQARAGVLMILPWKGGVEKKLKGKARIGTYRYLAMWQGLRGEDLDIDTAEETLLTCTKFGQDVLYTHDPRKYAR